MARSAPKHSEWWEATPAYGRDYKSQKEVMEHWHAGKDFMVHQGGQSTYFNKQDKPDHVGVVLHYGKGMKSMVIH
jgi:hypothetical protein